MRLLREYAETLNGFFRDLVEKKISELFPIESKSRKLELVKIEEIDVPNNDDLDKFASLKLEGGSWTMKVRVRLRLLEGDKVLDERTVTLFSVPVAGPHGTFLFKGTEYAIPTQLRLKPGTYYRFKDDGTVEARVNLSLGENFKVVFDPQNGKLRIVQGGKSIKLLPVLRALGATDEQLARAWGRERFEFVKERDDGSPSEEAKKLMSVAFSKRYLPLWQDLDPSDPSSLKVYFSRTRMDGEVNKIALGAPYESVSLEHLVDTVKALFEVAAQEREEMPPDSLLFKKAHAPWDFLRDILDEIIALSRKTLQDRMEKFDKIDKIVTPSYFQKPIDSFFAQSSIVQAVMSPNPIAILQSLRKVTYTGEGGIENDFAITLDQRSVDPYHLGFLDPVHTPEGERIGANLYIARNVKVRNGELWGLFFDVRRKKYVWLRPIDLYDKKVAFPKEGTIEGGTVRWKGKTARVVHKGKITAVSVEEVDLLVPDATAMFDVTSNLLPFLDSLQGNRAMMASKHLLQAISLAEREPPLVQVKADKESFEEKFGKSLALTAPVSGRVVKVEKDKIVIRDQSGKDHTVKMYSHLPLLNGHHISYVPLVKEGDAVEEGQVIADSNFTKGGVLATGVNLTVAYMPWKGFNYEDGIVITESAAKKLASEHVYVIEKKLLEGVEVDKEKFVSLFPSVYEQSQLQNIGPDGVVREGAEVRPGDPLILAFYRWQKSEWKDYDPRLQFLSDVRDDSVIWDKTVPGKVEKVVKTADSIKVIVRTVEPAKVGDKLAGRHGNKGTISLIIPDSEAPRTPDGRIIEVILNPIGVPSRLNPSQLLETALGKVALLKGKRFVVENFSDEDNVDKVLSALKKEGIEEKEKLYVPGEGETEEVFWGVQYFNKLEQQVEKKTNIRTVWGYDIDLQPLRGGEEGGGARAIDPLTLYSLVAHNVRNVLREMATYKAEKNDEFWLAIELGKVPPAPKPTFAFEKFLSYLKAAGVNVEKKGDELIAKPLSDEEVLKLAPSEVVDAGFLKAHDLKPERGGLFDPDIFGGPNGTKWAHVKLAFPVLNPIYEDVVRNLLGLSKGEMERLIKGELGVSEDGSIVPAGEAKYFGGEAFKALLSKIDPEKKIEELQKLIQSSDDPDEVTKYVRQLRVLRAIKDKQVDPKDFVVSVVPVLPPAFRPVYPSVDGGFFIVSPVNFRYRDLILFNKELKENIAKGTISEQEARKLCGKLYEHLKDLVLVGTKPGKEGKGILPYLAGEGSPKGGFIHSKLFKRRQELSSTLVIENGPDLGLDEVGIPEEAAWNLYRPFVVRQLVLQGYNLKKAKELVEKKDPLAREALEKELASRPLIINRAPSLHKFSIMAFRPKIVEGDALKLNPLVTAGFNADFDGDTMGIHVPATEEARIEAFKMLPSRNLFKEGTQGRFMFNLRLEYVGAIFNITQPPKEGSKPTRTFKDYDELLDAWIKRRVRTEEVVKLGRFVGTVGQHLINGLLPLHLKDYNEPWTGKKIAQALIRLAGTDKDLYVKVLETWKEIARIAMTRKPFSISLSDLKDKEMRALKPLLQEVEKIPSESERVKKMEEIVSLITQKLSEIAKQKYQENDLYKMFVSGAKGSASQIRQLVYSPVLVADHKGRPVPVPIKNDYGHGLDPAEYFAASFGARLGMLSKKLGVAEPGAINKEVLNTISDLVVTEKDDPEDPGMPVSPTSDAVLDRVLARDVVVRGKTVAKAGEVVTPKLRELLVKEKVPIVYVKSPITATTKEGIPATAVGVSWGGRTPEVGENVGVQAGQALTEPLSQETFNFFHTGGVAEKKLNILDVIKYLLHLPKKPDARAAVLAEVAGVVEKIEKLPSGATRIVISGKEHLVPAGKEIKVKVNDRVFKGQALTDGIVHPLQMSKLRSIYDAEKVLAEQLYTASKEHGIDISPVAAEVIARGVASTVAVVDPGPAKIPVGSYVPAQFVDKLNLQLSGVKEVPLREALGKKLAEPVGHIFAHTLVDESILKELEELNVKKVKVYEPVIKTVPVVKGTLTQPLYKEDFLHKMTFTRIKQTIPWSAASGERSPLTTTSPLTAWMYGAQLGYKEKGKY